jgi:hypothetical protein
MPDRGIFTLLISMRKNHAAVQIVPILLTWYRDTAGRIHPKVRRGRQQPDSLGFCRLFGAYHDGGRGSLFAARCDRRHGHVSAGAGMVLDIWQGDA